jgi:hypothetical protein
MRNLVKGVSVILAVGAFGQAIWAYNEASDNSSSGAFADCTAVRQQIQDYLASEVFKNRLELVSTDTEAKKELERVLQDLDKIVTVKRKGEPGP